MVASMSFRLKRAHQHLACILAKERGGQIEAHTFTLRAQTESSTLNFYSYVFENLVRWPHPAVMEGMEMSGNVHQISVVSP